MKDKALAIDSNIFAKLLTEEDGSDLAIKLFELTRKKQITIKTLKFSKVEFVSIVAKKYFLEELTEKVCHKILDVFSRMDIDFVDEGWNLLKSSFDLAKKLKLVTIYDCMFLELAKQLQIKFITADEKFLKIAKKAYGKCFGLKEYLKK